MVEVVTVEGLKELEKALAELPRATGKNVARRTLRKAGEPIAEAGARNAPRDEGHLQESYGVGTKLTRRQRRQHRRRDPIEVFVGPNDPAAIQTEFGNEHQSAHPHLRPAWDSESRTALNIVKSELGNEIEKAAKRLERKAARDALKAKS